MICQECQALLWEYIEGTLTKEQNQQIQTHLHTCSICQQEEKMLRQMYEALHTMPEKELPEGYHARLMQKINAEAAKDDTNIRPFPRKQQRSWKNIGLVAAAVVMVAALGGVQGLQVLRAPQQDMIAEMTQQPKMIENQTVSDANESIESMQQPETTLQIQTEQQTTVQQNAITEHTESQEPRMVTQTVADQKMESQKAVKKEAIRQAPKQNTAPITQPQKTVQEQNVQSSAGGQSQKNVQSLQSNENGVEAGGSGTAYTMNTKEKMVDERALDTTSSRAAKASTQEWAVEVKNISDAMEQMRTAIQEQQWTEIEATENSIIIEVQENQISTLYDVVQEIGVTPEELAITESDSTTQTQVSISFQTT